MGNGGSLGQGYGAKVDDNSVENTTSEPIGGDFPSGDRSSDYLNELTQENLESVRVDVDSMLKAYFISQLERLDKPRGYQQGFISPKLGNGWSPDRLIETTYKVEAIPVEEAVGRCLRRSELPVVGHLWRILKRLRSGTGELLQTPVVSYVPLWYVKGFHECLYLRASSYKVPVDEDVVAVEVEGRARDLIIERKRRSLFPSAITKRIPRIAKFFTDEAKYFVINDVVELAHAQNSGELYVTADGREIDSGNEPIQNMWKLKRILDREQLKVEGAIIQIAVTAETKERLIQRFREKIVKMPGAFKEILTNRFEITELDQYYLPYYSISVRRGEKVEEIILDGASGKPVDSKTAKALQRFAYSSL